MVCNPKADHRRSIRLKGYDYSRPGFYFVTICAQGHKQLFGTVKDRQMVLNDAGNMVNTSWNEISVYYKGIDIHEFIVMPNQIHGIIQIEFNFKAVGTGPCACTNNKWKGTDGQPQGAAPTMSLSDIVHRFKTYTTKKYIDGVEKNNFTGFNKKLWQRNYYEHVIRNEKSYNF